MPRQGTNELALEGKVIAASSYTALELVRLNGAPRVRWTMIGSSPEGFILPNQAAVATVFPAALPAGTRSCARFSLLSPSGYSGVIPFTITSGPHVVRRGSIAAAQTIPVTEPLYPARGPDGPKAIISAFMGRGGTTPTGAPPQARLAFFEVAPCR